MAVALALNYLEEMLAEPTEALTGTLPRRPSAPTRQRCARGEDHCKLIVGKLIGLVRAEAGACFSAAAWREKVSSTKARLVRSIPSPSIQPLFHSPSVTSAHRITVSPFKNASTTGSSSAGRLCPVTTVATITSQWSLKAIVSMDFFCPGASQNE